MPEEVFRVIEIRGADLGKLSQSLTDLERTLSTELGKAAERGARKLESDAKRSALALLPKRGGLAREVAATTFAKRRGAASFTVRATNRHAIGSIDRGRVRHPVFGNRNVWTTQRVRSGWWSGPVADTSRSVEREMRAAMDRLARGFGK